MKTSMYLLQRIDPRLAKEKDGAEDNFLTKVLISKQTTTESIKTETNAIKESFNLKTDDKLEELPKKTLDTNEVSEAKQAPSQKTKKQSKKSKNTKAQENIALDSKPAQSPKTKKTEKIKESQKGEIAQQTLPKSKEQEVENKVQKNQEIETAHYSNNDEEQEETPLLMPEQNLKQQAKPQMPQAQNTQNKGNILAESLAAKESTKDKNHKDSRKDERRQGKIAKSEESSNTQTKSTQLEERVNFDEMLQPLEEDKPTNLAELLQTGGKKQKGKLKESENDENKENKTSKNTAQKQSVEMNQTKETSRSQILYRSALAKENIRNFVQTLREEIQNYKPPITKLSMELNPRNLGSLELTITKKGKDLHIQVISNPTAIGLFLQNQVDFRNNLSQVGFENVDFNFDTSDKGGGENQKEQNNSQNNNNDKRNKNSLEDSQNEMNVMYITLPKYA